MSQLFCNGLCIGPGRFIHSFGIHIATSCVCPDRRADLSGQGAEMSFRLPTRHRGGHRPTGRVRQDDDERDFEMSHRIFDAPQDDIIDDIARHPDDEEIPQSLIEENLRRDPRVRASQQNGERALSCHQGSASLRILTRMFGCSLGEAAVAVQ